MIKETKHEKCADKETSDSEVSRKNPIVFILNIKQDRNLGVTLL